MATTTLVAILTRIRTVVEAGPLSLIAAVERFSATDDLPIPGDRAYWMEPGGLVSLTECGNYKQARIDAVEFSVALQVAFTEVTPDAMLTLLVSVARALVADGDAQGYGVHVGSMDAKYTRDQEFVVGVIALQADYDWSEV